MEALSETMHDAGKAEWSNLMSGSVAGVIAGMANLVKADIRVNKPVYKDNLTRKITSRD